MNKTKTILLALCLWGLANIVTLAEAPKKPNIILLMSDDQGWGDVGFNGNQKIQTPHLDTMASEGVRFDRFYAAAPLCSPTRGSCLTGRYPFRYGILAAHTGGMRVGELTVAELVKDQGYRTGHFGKWHIGWVKEADVSTRGFFSPPSQHGFDTHFATTSAVPTWDPTVTPEGWTKWSNKPGEPWKGGAPYVQDGVEVTENMDGDDSRIIMDRVIPFIEKNKDRPFLATVWFHAPHAPVVAGPEYLKRYADLPTSQQHLYGCITAMDEQIGRLRAKLKELKLDDSTVLFFCSDNGPADDLAKKNIASAGPFKGYKHKMYEGGLLVPACAVWPGVIQAGETTSVRCSTVDYLQQSNPQALASAQDDGNYRFALLCRRYLFMASQWARDGIIDRKVDYQIWCGPAMGAFNHWAKGSCLEALENRTVKQIAWNLLEGAAQITRAAQLRSFGVALPAGAFRYNPQQFE